MWKETKTARSPGLEHEGHTGKSDPGLDHTRKQAQDKNIQGCHGEAKAVAEGDHRRRESTSRASRAHGVK